MIKPPCAEDIVAIEGLLEAPLGSFTVLEKRDETRLRFNALGPVTVWRLAVTLPDYPGEIELFHWLVDDEWELNS